MNKLAHLLPHNRSSNISSSSLYRRCSRDAKKIQIWAMQCEFWFILHKIFQFIFSVFSFLSSDYESLFEKKSFLSFFLDVFTIIDAFKVKGSSGRSLWSYSTSACDNFQPRLLTDRKIFPCDDFSHQKLLKVYITHPPTAMPFACVQLHPKRNIMLERYMEVRNW